MKSINLYNTDGSPIPIIDTRLESTPHSKSYKLKCFRLARHPTYSTHEFYDTICGKEWDGTTLGTEVIEIAKPWHLRQMERNNQTYGDFRYAYSTYNKRTITYVPTGEWETQIVFPNYQQPITGTAAYAGDLIWAYPASMFDGGIGVVYSIISGSYQINTAIQWVDANVSPPRMWGQGYA